MSSSGRPSRRSLQISRGRIRAGCLLAAITAVAGVGGLSAHRLDEYLQAARIAIDPDRVQLELDLTPGIAVAEALLAGIDRDRDGALADGEQRTYSHLVLDAVDLQVDGRRLPMQLVTASFPSAEAVRRGEGTIRLQSTAMLPRLSNGPHQLSFRNRHHPDRGVYLANALVPATDAVAITGQRRDGDQSALTIDYVLGETPGTARAAWLLAGIAAAALLLALVVRASRRGE